VSLIPAPNGWGEIIKSVGAPTLITIILLTQFAPRVDRGILIAERVDQTLTIVAANCGALTQPARLP
jgi:hypothetical protein